MKLFYAMFSIFAAVLGPASMLEPLSTAILKPAATKPKPCIYKANFMDDAGIPGRLAATCPSALGSKPPQRAS